MQETVRTDIISALKSGDKPKAEALKLLLGALKNAEIAAGHVLTEEEAIKVVKKEMKSRVEARDIFAANDRQEQADKEEFERSVYADYAPKDLSQDEISEIIKTEALKLGDGVTFSQLMPQVMRATKGQADGKLVSGLVNEYLGNNQ
jgi:uncharacterized protein YqeY